MEDADGRCSGFSSDALGLVEATADDPQSQLMIKNAVDRRVCHIVQAPQGDIGVVGYASGVAKQQNKKNVGVGRERLCLFQHSLEGEVIPVNEVDPAGI